MLCLSIHVGVHLFDRCLGKHLGLEVYASDTYLSSWVSTTGPQRRHVMVTTGTASGKSMCYTLPLLHSLAKNPSTRALFLFPTKVHSSSFQLPWRYHHLPWYTLEQ
jgi:hypothetical protein